VGSAGTGRVGMLILVDRRPEFPGCIDCRLFALFLGFAFDSFKPPSEGLRKVELLDMSRVSSPDSSRVFEPSFLNIGGGEDLKLENEMKVF
jgi:hypothetical protein